ncbi:SOUL heme-binding protein [Methanomicrobiaceae archaeon CYW5]|uniref:SOUL family heme-binding protein n=1 Tax=Methanovulcanius yangii TaxID=1789227 RepID=UPI0029C9E92C|nr:heme-binding protein [Methanovulcanius yangii]MBT8506943.1 SOUL heme-binding protein [Methanovulcanius yangii]
MTETVPYEITGTAGEIEFRKYPPLVLATVESPGDDSGFNLLFAYISGHNSTRDTISMTSPVITSEKIPMTAPVVSDTASMSFVMPPGKRRDEIPAPVDGRVRIVPVPEREVAVIRFRGYARRDEVAAVEVRLKEGLRKAGVHLGGEPFLMRYNPPWTPGFLRRNEVGVEIRR